MYVVNAAVLGAMMTSAVYLPTYMCDLTREGNYHREGCAPDEDFTKRF